MLINLNIVNITRPEVFSEKIMFMNSFHDMSVFGSLLFLMHVSCKVDLECLHKPVILILLPN